MKYNGKIYFDNKSLEVNEQMMTLGLEMRGGGRGVLSTDTPLSCDKLSYLFFANTENRIYFNIYFFVDF